MPDEFPNVRPLAAADLGPTERLLAELVFEPVRARFQLMARRGTLKPETARQLRKLLPKLPKAPSPDQQTAFDIISAVQVLAKALGNDVPEDSAGVGQAQDMSAEEMMGEELLAQGDTGKAD